MTRDEVKEFLGKVLSVYPSWKPENMTLTVNTWLDFLKNEDKKYLDSAFTDYVKDGNKFAPSLSELLSLAKKYRPDPRFEGVDYWENKTRGIYPYPWRMDVYRTWYTNDREAGRFHRYLQSGIKAVEEGRVNEDELRDLKYVLKVYEEKKCSMMKKA